MAAGILLVIIGLFWILGDFGLLPDGMSRLWLLWPLVLVAAGLEILLRDRPRGRQTALLITLVLLALSLFRLFAGGYGGLRSEKIDLNLAPDVELVTLEISPRLADFELTAGAGNGKLLTGEIELLPGERLHTSNRRRGRRQIVSLSTSARRLHWNGPGPRWRLRLNSRPSYRLRLNLDVGGGLIDLRGLKIEDCSLKFGVGKAAVYLPDHPGSYELSGGVGELTIYLPETTAVILEASRGIGSLEINGLSGGAGVWRRGAGEPLRLKVVAGIGRIRILPSP